MAHPHPRHPAHPAQRLLLLALATGLTCWLAACDSKPAPAKREARVVKLLPDTPPPPPPPPKPEEKKPEPKDDKQQQQQQQPKPEPQPEPQQLKSDEAAGDGPGNGMTAGTVNQDYDKGPTGGGSGGTAASAPPPPEPGPNRFVINAYGNATSKSLNEYLVRDKAVKLRDYKVRVELWLTPNGALQRYELVDSTGDTDTDTALRDALGRYPGTGNAVPAKLPQPVRVLITNRMMG